MYIFQGRPLLWGNNPIDWEGFRYPVARPIEQKCLSQSGLKMTKDTKNLENKTRIYLNALKTHKASEIISFGLVKQNWNYFSFFFFFISFTFLY